MSDCFPDATLDEMWRVLEMLSTSKVGAENGLSASLQQLSDLPPHDNKVNRYQSRASTGLPSWSSHNTPTNQSRAKKLRVQNVFTVQYNSWPLGSDDHRETVNNAGDQ